MASDRTSAGQFAKGASGNPQGRPKMAEELSQGIREFCETVGLKKLKALADDPDPRVRLVALQFAFDRAYGKAVTPTDLKMEGDLSQAHLAALQELGRTRERPDDSAAKSDAPADQPAEVHYGVIPTARTHDTVAQDRRVIEPRRSGVSRRSVQALQQASTMAS